MLPYGSQHIPLKIKFHNVGHPIYDTQKSLTSEIRIIKIQNRTKSGSMRGNYHILFLMIRQNLRQSGDIPSLHHFDGFSVFLVIVKISPPLLKHAMPVAVLTSLPFPQPLICENPFSVKSSRFFYGIHTS